MKERRPRLLQRRRTRLRIQHIDVFVLLRVRNLHPLLAATTQKTTHRLVLRACTAVFDGGEGAWGRVEHALGVGWGLRFIEDVFGW